MSHCCAPPATHYRAPLILLNSNRSPEDQEREQKEGLWMPASKFVNNCDRFNCARKGERRQEGNGYRESCSQAADASRDSRESSLRDFYSVTAFLCCRFRHVMQCRKVTSLYISCLEIIN